MTDQQAADIIDGVIKSHWPNWSFSIIETKEWVRTLKRFDFDKAKSAISEFYMAQTKQGKPAPGSLIMALKAKAVVRDNSQPCERIVPLFGIHKTDGRLRWHKFCGNPNMAQQEIEAMALKFTRYANQFEPGHYSELYSTEPEPEGYTGEPGGTFTQRRQQARDKAFTDILNGPDTITKRWLQKYLTRKYKAEDEAKRLTAKDMAERIGESLVI